MKPCKKCGSNVVLREQGPTGDTKCLNCDFKTSSIDWDSVGPNKDEIIAKLKSVVEHYAGEPFNTNDIYLDIFDLFKVENSSVRSFDSDKFAERAQSTLRELFPGEYE